MAAARFTMPACLDCLLRSEMERIIEEANLGTVNTLVAKRYLIDQWPQIRVLIKRGPGNRGPTECGTTHEATSAMSS